MNLEEWLEKVERMPKKEEVDAEMRRMFYVLCRTTEFHLDTMLAMIRDLGGPAKLSECLDEAINLRCRAVELVNALKLARKKEEGK